MKAILLRLTGILTVPVCLVVLPACGDRGSNSGSSEDSGQEIIKREVVLSPEAQDLLNRFPTPFDVTAELQKAKAPYLLSLCN